jgi:hypothetical protein
MSNRVDYDEDETCEECGRPLDECECDDFGDDFYDDEEGYDR